MALITIKSIIAIENVSHVINQIYKTCIKDNNLSTRSRKEILSAYKKNNFLFAYSENHIIGWILKIPYNQSIQELAAGYVFKEYRPKGTFSLLVDEAVKDRPISCIVTFNKQVEKYFIFKGFKKSSLWKIVKLTQGKFLLSRINIQRLSAIIKHYQKNKPIYLIYKK